MCVSSIDKPQHHITADGMYLLHELTLDKKDEIISYCFISEC